MPCHWFEHEPGFQLDDQRKAPITLYFAFDSRHSTRHGAGYWHPPTEQLQDLPHRRRTPQQRGPRLRRPQCWSPYPVAPRFRRNHYSCITPCRFRRCRRPTRITHPRHRPIMWGRTGILSECPSGHHTNTTEDQVPWTFPNRGILWHMSQGKGTTLGTGARQGTTYRLGFRCPLPRPFPQARTGHTVWAAITIMGSRCIRRSTIINHRCLPVFSRARHKDLKGCRYTPRNNTRTTTMAKANRIHRPTLGLLFLAHINH